MLHLHLALLHCLDEVELSLSDLDDLLNESSADLLFDVMDPEAAELAHLLLSSPIPRSCPRR